MGDDRTIPEQMSRILSPLCEGDLGCGDCLIRLIGGGQQGETFAVQRRNGGLIGGEAAVAVKLYHTLPTDFDLVGEQHEALTQLHGEVDGRRSAGWLLRVPRPVGISRDPAALVSTLVPGVPLPELLQCGRVDAPDDLDSLAEATLFGLDRLWFQCGRLHGDLHMDNILCDPDRRTLAFVDPGMNDPPSEWSHIPRRWYPVSRDLGHHLFHATSNVKSHLGRPWMWRFRVEWSEQMLQLFCRRLSDPVQRRQLLEETRICCDLHLAGIRTSWTPPGLWRRVVQRFSSAHINRVLERVERRAAAEAVASEAMADGTTARCP